MNNNTNQSALRRFRILDLTRGWSGPVGARLLGDLGAEVIKIEHLMGRGPANVDPPLTKDFARICENIFPDNDPGDEPYNRLGPFNEYNRNKLSLTLNLKAKVCKDIFLQLVSISDLVIENYSSRVMKNFGLDYPILRKINPTIVMVSMPGFGMTGPNNHYVSYGTNIEPTAGLSNIMGYKGSLPYKSGEAYPDPNAGVHMVGAVLAALFYRSRTGIGQYIDLSQNEAMIGLIGEAILDYSQNGKMPQRIGNAHPQQAPHGCYPCEGNDRWVTIAITTNKEWLSLCGVLGNPQWANNAKYATQAGRWEDRDKIDAHLTSWTKTWNYKNLMHHLQANGIPSGSVFTNQDVMEDPHLKQRGYIWNIPHKVAGTLAFTGVPIHLNKTPGRLSRPSPMLGEHNGLVLKEFLGISSARVGEMADMDYIGEKPPL